MRTTFAAIALYLLLIPLLIPSVSNASTLDPTHPLWTNRGADHAAWMDALRELSTQRAMAPKWHDLPAARGNIAAVGRRVLVIPVLPADAPEAPLTNSELDALWNGSGEGSVHGYWEFVSAGGLQLELRVLPWLRVPGTLRDDYPNVIDGNPAANLSAGPRQLARDALAAAAAIVEDLHAFDDDGPDQMPGSGDDDSILDMVVVLHPFQAWETNPVDVERAIVSLQSRLNGHEIEGHELAVDAFVVTSATAPLGVWVHELGHLLGLPDLYDLDRSPLAGTPGDVGPQGGLGRWSLMASGTWGGEGGDQPAGLDAWSRSRLGFAQQQELAVGATVQLPWISADSAISLRLCPLGQWGEEVFLVEARHPRVGAIVDGDLPGEGALVYRVRPDLAQNTIAAKFVELIQADDLDDIGQGRNDGDATDPWTGITPADRFDGSSSPSSESVMPSPLRTAPALLFTPQAAGMRVEFSLASSAALRLDSFGVEDNFRGVRPWLHPGETAELRPVLIDSGQQTASSALLEVVVDSVGRRVELLPSGPITLIREGSLWVPESVLEIRDLAGTTESGTALLKLRISVDLGPAREVSIGLPVRFFPGLEDDALVRFSQEILAAPLDTTRFVQAVFADLPRPALVGYELQTGGGPGYANGVELTLVSDWFAADADALAWVWTRGMTEAGSPGQVFDGAAIEVLRPDRGWNALLPEGDDPVWISRRSEAATRDRHGFGGERPVWSSWSLPLPTDVLPLKIRVRFASDASIAGGWWQVAGLQTNAAPRATISVQTLQSGLLKAEARLSGNFSRVNLGQYRYQERAGGTWLTASGFFSITSSEILSIILDKLPEAVLRARLGLFSGQPGAAYLIGETAFRRDPLLRMPRLLRNPSHGHIVLQQEDRTGPLALSVYDLRGRRRARFSIPAHTTWYEWVPRSENGSLLSSGKYFLRADEMDLGTLRFTWFR